MQTNSLVKSQKITIQQWVGYCEHQSTSTVLYFSINAALHSQNCASLNLRDFIAWHSSCLINAQPLPLTALQQTTTWMAAQGHDLTHESSLPSAISLTSYAHFAARLGSFFNWTRCFESNVPFDNTAPIYLINLLWKLGLRFRLESELHYFSICHEE